MASKFMIAALLFFVGLGSSGAQEKKKSDEKEAPAAGTAATAPQAAHTFTITPEDVARPNLEKFTEVSVERGKKLFLTQCAMCHGKAGDGKGEAVEEMGISPPDFTKAETLKNRTDGELFAIVGGGSEVMPGQGKRMRDKQVWQLVNFIRALGGKIPEKATGKEPEENVILVPQ